MAAAMIMYEVTVPGLIRGLTNMSAFLEKGQAWAREQAAASSSSPEEAEKKLLSTRLSPDMGDLMFQVQRASDHAKGTVVRAGRYPNVRMEDNETTFDQAFSRLRRTIEFLEGVPEDVFHGKGDLPVENLAAIYKDRGWVGWTYVTEFCLPSFYFHVSMAYAILRMAGVPIGKMEYIGYTHEGLPGA